jgi:hypothetical protein
MAKSSMGGSPYEIPFAEALSLSRLFRHSCELPRLRGPSCAQHNPHSAFLSLPSTSPGEDVGWDPPPSGLLTLWCGAVSDTRLQRAAPR